MIPKPSCHIPSAILQEITSGFTYYNWVDWGPSRGSGDILIKAKIFQNTSLHLIIVYRTTVSNENLIQTELRRWIFIVIFF